MIRNIRKTANNHPHFVRVMLRFFVFECGLRCQLLATCTMRQCRAISFAIEC